MIYKRIINDDIFQDCYEVVSIGAEDVTDNGILTIPSMHNGTMVASVGKSAAAGIKAAKLIIRPGVARICESAFEGSSLKKALIPASVREMGKRAFKNCKELKSIVPFDRVNVFIEMGLEVFMGCEKLSEVLIEPRTVPISAFEGCKSLSKTKLNGIVKVETSGFKGTRIKAIPPDTDLKYIGPDAFSECCYLNAVHIPDGAEVKDGAFSGCLHLRDLTMGDNITLGESVFLGCKELKSTNWPQSLHTIPYGTFCDCYHLESLQGAEEITRIGGYAFYNTAIPDVNMFPKAASIGRYAFDKCRNMKNKKKVYA